MGKLFDKYKELYHLNDEKIALLNKISYHNPNQMQGISQLVDCIYHNRHKKWAIRSDYDTDGIGAAVIARVMLEAIGINAQTIFPTVKTGYGLTINSAKDLIHQMPDVEMVLTADCGITNEEGIAYLKSHGIDVIVTDHHPGKTDNLSHPNSALAVVDPHRADLKETYPFKDLSGTGVLYKVFEVYCEKYASHLNDLLNRLKPLVAMTIISDVMPVVDENRSFIIEGLSKEPSHQPDDLPAMTSFVMGWQALTILVGHKIDVKDLGWSIAPMLNSSKRMNFSAKEAYEVFMQNDLSQAIEKVYALQEINQKRKDLTQSIVNSVEAKQVVVVKDPGAHGVMGLIASKISNEIEKPAVALFDENNFLSGSARAPQGYSLQNILSKIETISGNEILINWGGHASAAGLQIKKERLKDFTRLFILFSEKPDLEVAPLKKLTIDDILPESNKHLKELVNDFYKILSLSPFSHEMPYPCVAGEISSEPKILKNKHTSFTINPWLKVLKWNYIADGNPQMFEGELSINEFRGDVTFQVMSSLMKPSIILKNEV